MVSYVRPGGHHQLAGYNAVRQPIPIGTSGSRWANSPRTYTRAHHRGRVRATREPNAIKELDWDHWSDWSEPLPLTGEEQITAPAPRSYFQFKVEFESRAFSATAVLASLSLNILSHPLPARSLR